MLKLSAYTVGCNPTWTSTADDLDDAKDQALKRLEWIKGRSFGADDSSQVEGTESEYDDMAVAITGISAVDEMLELGPLPCGYCIKIDP